MTTVSADEGRAFLVDRLRAVADGDKAALREVYDRTSAKLFGICLRILGNREEAEDVLQDVYLTVWNRADSFDPGRASPITWMATIARNRSIDRLRQIGPRAHDRSVDEAVDVADKNPDALELLHRADEGRQLAACLGELDERTRDAVAAAFFGGLTYDELARRAEVPLGTMKSVIRRGLMKLKGCLSQ
ncbi:sigma-70 family RNA polymerase sigma factor [Aurantimonas sp. A3-2-R12]|uniref:sigma-70 family RNA polymerase sigma factor n=1 Tax=Aurantimonas sp. A3-2-R12 TaxID=3114362 RepID=UPI002E18FE3C|nr:sigma-70 family RNA polymerase sigma factor [Aurantimonas sp. A3-2-R12]